LDLLPSPHGHVHTLQAFANPMDAANRITHNEPHTHVAFASGENRETAQNGPKIAPHIDTGSCEPDTRL